MSPVKAYRFQDKNRFPRVSGDEPNARYTCVDSDRFSPRERG